jgi:hypothetical protein
MKPIFSKKTIIGNVIFPILVWFPKIASAKDEDSNIWAFAG